MWAMGWWSRKALRSGCRVERLAQPKCQLGRNPREWGLLLDEEATCKKVNFMKLKANIGVLFRISALVSCER